MIQTSKRGVKRRAARKRAYAMAQPQYAPGTTIFKKVVVPHAGYSRSGVDYLKFSSYLTVSRVIQ